MKYPNKIKIYFKDSRFKRTPKQLGIFKRNLVNFKRFTITRAKDAYVWSPRGVDYVLDEEIVESNDSIILSLRREDLEENN